MNTSIIKCRTEAQVTPLGIDCKSPMFSWQMDTLRVSAKQTAYRIVVSKDEAFTNLFWDSQLVACDCQHAALANAQLQPSTWTN